MGPRELQSTTAHYREQGSTLGTHRPPWARELTTFFGRAKELETLASLLADATPLLTVTGPPGIGKTRLVRRLLSAHGPPPERTLFCDLRGVTTTEGLIAKVAENLPIHLEQGHHESDVANAVADLLVARGPTVVALDNFDQLIPPGIDLVFRWIQKVPETCFVVTSRRMLRLQAERTFEVSPLPIPSPGEEQESEAVRLFVDRAKAIEPAFDDSDLSEVRLLAGRLEGLPLALELAAGQMRHLRPRALLQRLDEQSAIGLEATVRDIDPQHRSLRAAIESSWHQLEPFERSALAQLTCCRQGFTLQAAEAILDLDRFPQSPCAAEVIASLREATLLRVDRGSPGSGPARWDMYEAIREFASEGRPADTEQRHAEHYRSFGRTWAGKLGTQCESDALGALRRELGNLEAAFEWFVGSEARDGGRAVSELALVLFEIHRTARPALAIAPLTRALDRADEDTHRTRLFMARGVCHRSLGATSYAQADFHAARAHAGDDELTTADIDVEEAALSFCRGDIRRARTLLHRAVTVSESHSAPALEMRARSWLGTVLNQGFQDRAAIEHYDRAIELAEARGDRRTQSLVRTMRVACEVFQQLDGQPEASLDEQILIAREHRDTHVEVMAQQVLGIYYLDRDLRDKSRSHLIRARELAVLSGLSRLKACTECWLAALDEVEEIPADLPSRRRRTVEAFRAVGDSRTKAFALLEVSAQTAHEGDVANAYEQLERGEQLGRKFGEAAIGLLAELQRARIELTESQHAENQGDLPLARRLAEAAEARVLEAKRRSPPDSEGSERTVLQCSPESRWALRRFQHEAAFFGPAVLQVSSDGSGFRIDGGDPVHLPDGPIIRQALLGLAERHLEDPRSEFTNDDFMKRCWPGQRVSSEVSSQRVRQVVTRLRKAGLKPWLRHNRTGYLFDTGIAVRVVPPTSLLAASDETETTWGIDAAQTRVADV